MPTPRYYSALYNCIVESYTSVEELMRLCHQLELGEPMVRLVRQNTVGETAKSLINYCQYQGLTRELIRLVVKKASPEQREELRYSFEKAGQIAVNITPDLREFIVKYRDFVLEYKGKFLHDIASGDNMCRVYVDLANTLDQCRYHVVVLGDPACTNVNSSLFQIEHYCAFFWDLPTYFLLREDYEKEWRSRIFPMRVPPKPKLHVQDIPKLRDTHNLAEGGILLYSNDLDMQVGFRDLFDILWQRIVEILPPPEDARERCKSTIVRFEEKPGTIVGTGFIVSTQDGEIYAITCAHVIKDLGKKLGDVIELNHFKQDIKPLKGKVRWLQTRDIPPDCWCADEDVSILELKPPLSDKIPALPLTERSRFCGKEDCFCFGYPKTKGIYGALIDHISWGGVVSDGYELLKQNGEEKIAPGVSGAPLCDSQGEVLGLIRAMGDPRAKEVEAYLIPTRYILDAISHLKN